MFWSFLLVIVNLINGFLALSVGEYELAKLRTPDASWLPTPHVFDLITIVIVVLLVFVNLAVLYFVLRRRLVIHLKWLFWSTLLATMMALALALVLGDRFWPIVWPH